MFLPNGNWQTFFNPIMSRILKKKNPIQFERELFKFQDGGTIGIDWVDQIPIDGLKKPVLLIVPGLTSDSDEIYVLNLLIEGKKSGYRGGVINYRGCSQVPLTVSL